jgi:hypothetical protein
MAGTVRRAGAPPCRRRDAPIAFGAIDRREETVAEKEGRRFGKGSAAALLSTWRAAERDRVAAEESASVASLAAVAATEAASAAIETAEAAKLSLEASQRAEHAARRTAEAAEVAARTASRESNAADQSVIERRAAEDVARERFHAGQREGFPKERD